MAPKPTIFTLPRGRRRMYFQLLVAVFVVAVPLLFLYATGYRFERITGLMETGGIYVGAELSGAEIYLNDTLVHETGTFRHAFYIPDLDPGKYTISVSKPGYYSWGKTLEVYAQIVTEAQAFNLPKDPPLELIPQTFTNQTTNATTTVLLSNPVYEETKALFATTTATTTKESRGMQLSDDGAHIVARWLRTAESAPFYFCVREGECVDHIPLNTKGEQPSYFDFFPGTTDLVLVTLPDGVYATEFDNRSGQNIQPLYLAPHADFRVIDGVIYVKTDDRIYKVEL